MSEMDPHAVTEYASLTPVLIDEFNTAVLLGYAQLVVLGILLGALIQSVCTLLEDPLFLQPGAVGSRLIALRVVRRLGEFFILLTIIWLFGAWLRVTVSPLGFFLLNAPGYPIVHGSPHYPRAVPD